MPGQLHCKYLKKNFCKLFAYAAPKASSKWNEAEPGSILGMRWYKAVRVKFLLVSEVICHVVCVTDTINNIPALGNLVSLEKLGSPKNRQAGLELATAKSHYGYGWRGGRVEGLICITERCRVVSKAVSSGVLCSGKLRLRTTAEQTGWGMGRRRTHIQLKSLQSNPKSSWNWGIQPKGLLNNTPSVFKLLQSFHV